MPKDYADRIAKLKEQREKIEARLNTLGQKAKADERKRDTRRKIIVGGAIIVQMEKDAAFAAHVGKLLNASVGRQIDREAIADLIEASGPLFAAPPHVPSAPVTPPPASSPPAAAPIASAAAFPPPSFPPSAPTARQNLESLEGEMARFLRRPDE